MVIYIALFLLGVSFGSFINALVWRLRQQDLVSSKLKVRKVSKKPLSAKQNEFSILSGRSMCPGCRHQLAWYDLIPVFSWLSLKGRCRYCHQPISAQYPLVELGTSALFVISYLLWEFNGASEAVSFGFWLFYLTVLMALLVYDLRWMLLPNKLTYLLLLAVTAEIIIVALIDNNFSVINQAAWGLLAIGGLFAALFYGSGGRWLGGGDVKLAAFMGLVLGWQQGILAVMVAAYLGTAVFGGLWLLKKHQLSRQLPFGPLLITGTLVAFFWGRELVDFYLRLSGLN